MSIVFLQKRAHKAGAQTCLARLLRHERIQALHPVLITSQSGWLTHVCDKINVQHIEQRFPSSRSLAGRLVYNMLFVAQLKRQLDALGITPGIIHANDHSEGVLTHKLARVYGAKSAIFLRSSPMHRRDYFKYRCHLCDLVITVGEEIQQRAKAWDIRKDIVLVYDALYPAELWPPKEKAPSFPHQLLVIGSHLPEKGWQDLIEALYRLAQERAVTPLTLDFTGVAPDLSHTDLALKRLPHIRVNFLGRVEDFQDLVRHYDLVINPSRQESFGMAAIEVLAAGVPLLSSRTGVIEQVQDREYLLFAPNDPADLARALRYLMQHWDRLDLDATRCQEQIRQRFDIDDAVEKLLHAYGSLLHGS